MTSEMYLALTITFVAVLAFVAGHYMGRRDAIQAFQADLLRQLLALDHKWTVTTRTEDVGPEPMRRPDRVSRG